MVPTFLFIYFLVTKQADNLPRVMRLHLPITIQYLVKHVHIKTYDETTHCALLRQRWKVMFM